MSHLEISMVTSSATSSPASPAGVSPSNAQAYLQTDLFGQEAVPVRPFPAPESRKASRTSETCGQSFSGSSASAALNGCLASRLRELCDTVGSTVYSQTWREKATPSGLRYWAHTARAPTTSDKDCTGWPTPNARDGKDLSKSNAHLAARLRHTPSTVTMLLTRGRPWWAISQIYGRMMGFDYRWHEAKLKATATPSA